MLDDRQAGPATTLRGAKRLRGASKRGGCLFPLVAGVLLSGATSDWPATHPRWCSSRTPDAGPVLARPPRSEEARDAAGFAPSSLAVVLWHVSRAARDSGAGGTCPRRCGGVDFRLARCCAWSRPTHRNPMRCGAVRCPRLLPQCTWQHALSRSCRPASTASPRERPIAGPFSLPRQMVRMGQSSPCPPAAPARFGNPPPRQRSSTT